MGEKVWREKSAWVEVRGDEVSVSWVGGPTRRDLTVAHAAFTRDLIQRFGVKGEDEEKFLMGLVRLVRGLEEETPDG